MSSNITIGQTVRVLPPSPFAGWMGQVTAEFIEGKVEVVLWNGFKAERMPFKLNLLEVVEKEVGA